VNLSLAKALDRAAGNAIAAAFNGADALESFLEPPRPQVERVTGVLVVKFWGIGNWALLRPVVADLRARWPGARLLALTLEGNRPLVDDLADETLVVRPRGTVRAALDLVRAVRRVRRLRPELAVDFEQFARAGALVARAASVPQRVGFASSSRARDRLYTALVPFRRDAHASRSFRDLAEAAGVAPGPYAAGGLAPSARGRAEAEAALAGLPPAAPLVLLHPGSGDNFPGRRWSEAGFAAAGRRAAQEHGAALVVTGSAGEAALCARVAAAAGARDLSGRLSLEGLVGCLARAALLLSNDTGPVHLASALGRPVLAVFGPNTPVLYGPLSPGSRAFYRGLPCSPCLTTANYRSSRCRLPTCMHAIATGEVLSALDRALARPRPATEPWVPGSR
jgi:ADP-heptose:LPS heptosyltransferase